MKRFVLSILLLAVIVAASWAKTLWDERRAEERFRRDSADLVKERDNLAQIVDSLTIALGSTRDSLEWMIVKQRETLAFERDSLRHFISELQSQVVRLSGELDKADRQLMAVEAKYKKKSPGIDHRRILAFYTQRHQKLPTDLTAYEQRVALDEIKQLTAKKFSISVAALDAIVKDIGREN